VVRNGQARGTTNNVNDTSGFGGGILLNGGKLHSCIVRGNVAFNMSYSASNPGRGGGVFITDAGGDVVNCVIAFNMDDKGLGIDGDGGAVVNNTIARNANAPKFVKIPGNADGSFDYRHYTPGTTLVNTMAGPYIRLNDFYIATTETTQGQYSCFLSAVELTNNLAINQQDWANMCNASTPAYGYTDISIKKYLGIQDAEITTSPQIISTGSDGLHIQIGGTAGSGSEVFFPSKVTSKYSAGTSGSTAYPADPLVRENFPMEYVTWYGAVAYSAWLGGMLPTEAQWEFAARRTNTGIQVDASYAGGTTVLNDVAWWGYASGNANATHHEVATLNPTQLGLYDMNGNCWEWVCDWYNSASASSNGAYPTGNSVLGTGTATNGCYSVNQNAGVSGSAAANPLFNPVYNYKTGSTRVIRGSCWTNDAARFPLGFRNGDCAPSLLDPAVGFRPVGCVACP
jgi:formylglycine-generating enzyme required for sulfatase activity